MSEPQAVNGQPVLRQVGHEERWIAEVPEQVKQLVRLMTAENPSERPSAKKVMKLFALEPKKK